MSPSWNHRRSSSLLYYVKWAGYEGTDKENSWISASELTHANDLLRDFHLQNPDKPGPINNPGAVANLLEE